MKSGFNSGNDVIAAIYVALYNYNEKHRDDRDLSMVSSRRYVQMSRSRLGLKSWHLGLCLDLDLSGLEPIAIFTQIY